MPSRNEAYKASKGNSDAARRRVKRGAHAPAQLSIPSIASVSPLGMGEGGSVTSLCAGVPQRRDVFGYDTCVYMFIWVPSHTGMDSLAGF